jgi:hypothetical protein
MGWKQWPTRNTQGMHGGNIRGAEMARAQQHSRGWRQLNHNNTYMQASTTKSTTANQWRQPDVAFATVATTGGVSRLLAHTDTRATLQYVPM